MMNLFLDVAPLQNVNSEIAAYHPYVQALAYVIVAILAVVGAISVSQAYQSGDPEARQKAVRLVGACIFFCVAVTGIPKFFDVDVSGSTSSTGDVIRGFVNPGKGAASDIHAKDLYTIDLPSGGTAVIRPSF